MSAATPSAPTPVPAPAHVHGSAPPPQVRGRGALMAAVVLIALATLAGLVLLRPGPVAVPDAAPVAGERVRAVVEALRGVPCSDRPSGAAPGDAARDPAPGQRCLDVTVRLQEGPERGQALTTRTAAGQLRDRGPGDEVVLLRAGGAGVPVEARYQLADVPRGRALLLLAALFGAAVLALGRLRGALALAGLAVSLTVLVGFLVPALLSGRPPVPTAVVGASAVMLVVLVLTHGPGLRTATAVVGTAVSLLLVLALATAFGRLAGLTGLAGEEAQYVGGLFPDVDLRGLLLAGIVVGTLGILDDVTVTQVSTVWELRAADPARPGRELYAAALRVGRDHIASTVNTLLLAYAGASLPLLVLFTTSGLGLMDTLTSAVVAEEVVRTLAGGIGLVAAVPVTTALATAMCPPVTQVREAVGGQVPGQGAPAQSSSVIQAR